MERAIVKYSIIGILKSITGNDHPNSDDASLRSSMKFDDKGMAYFLHLIERNFLIELKYLEVGKDISINQLVDLSIQKVIQNQEQEQEIYYS